MGSGESKDLTWIPGYVPHDFGEPYDEKDFASTKEGIVGAYREAYRLVKKDPQHTFCTIGPQMWLKCWKIKEKKPEFVKNHDVNVGLYFNSDQLTLHEGYKDKFMSECGIDHQGHVIF